MNEQFSREQRLIGKENLEKLLNSKVAVFGIGGVGSFVAEGLARAGIGSFLLVDNDVVDITNINRQIHANFETIGKPKVELMKKRILSINPEARVETSRGFVVPKNLKRPLDEDIQKFDLEMLKRGINLNSNFNSKDQKDQNYVNDLNSNSQKFDYIIDAIDTISAKIELIEYANKINVPIISAMGTGNKLEPEKLVLTDVYKTHTCPLAKIIRKELRKRKIKNLSVVYSEEEPKKPNDGDLSTPASISFVPSVAGLMIASKVVRDIINYI